MIRGRKRACRNPKCPCVEHLPPAGFNFYSAQAVPPLGEGPIAAYVYRVETDDGEREAFVRTREADYRDRLPLPVAPPESWADAIDRARRFVARKPVTA